MNGRRAFFTLFLVIHLTGTVLAQSVTGKLLEENRIHYRGLSQGIAANDAAKSSLADTTPESFYPAIPLANRQRNLFSLSLTEAQVPLLERYLSWYRTLEGKKLLAQAVSRGAPFLDHIRRIIERANLPPELLWLPLIESSFRPEAVSPSGATGLWQFMMNSIAPYPIEVNSWMDERRDFWKSTDAALHKLEYNYRVLGDWLLALAAYNCGLGRVQRAVAAAGSSSFALLSRDGWLPEETVHYLPRFLAAAAILSETRYHGFDTSWSEPFHWKRVPLEQQISISLLAERADIDKELLKKGNAELFFHFTPPANSHYMVKVPEKSADRVRRVLSSEEGSDLMKYTIHRVRTGDTLYALSRHFGVTIAMILSINPGIIPESLAIGSELLIPVSGKVTTFTPPIISLPLSETYTVEKGDTLWSIARVYGTSPEIIASGNGIKIDDILFPGRTLKVPQNREEME